MDCLAAPTKQLPSDLCYNEACSDPSSQAAAELVYPLMYPNQLEANLHHVLPLCVTPTVVTRESGGVGTGEEAGKRAALGTSDCWVKPTCAPLCKMLLPREFDLSECRGVQLQ